MSLFPAYVASGAETGTHVRKFKPSSTAGEAFIVGDLVVVQTGEAGEAEFCGADPTLIAGISEIDSEKARVLTPDGLVPIRIITGANVVLGLSSTTTPAYATHVGNSYGITRATGGQWQLDTGKTTTSSRCRVVDIDIASGTFFVVMHQNVLQFADLTVATA